MHPEQNSGFGSRFENKNSVRSTCPDCVEMMLSDKLLGERHITCLEVSVLARHRCRP